MKPVEFAQAMQPLVDLYKEAMRGRGINVPESIGDYGIVRLTVLQVKNARHWNVELYNATKQVNVTLLIRPLTMEITPRADKTYRFCTAQRRYQEVVDIEVK